MGKLLGFLGAGTQVTVGDSIDTSELAVNCSYLLKFIITYLRSLGTRYCLLVESTTTAMIGGAKISLRFRQMY